MPEFSKGDSAVFNDQASSSIKLHQEEYGNGDPILCLHGLGGNIFTWRNFIKPFSRNHKLILVDLRGFGASPKPIDPHYSLEEHADQIYGIILRDNLTKLTLIGNSLGGAVALLVASRLCEQEPNRLSKLVLIAAGAYKEYLPRYLKLMRTPLGAPMIYLAPSRLATRFVLQAAYYDSQKLTIEQTIAYSGPMASRGGRHALLQTAKQCIPPRSDEMIAKLSSITVPTLLLWGREDAVIPLKVGQLLEQAIPNSKLEVIDNCGHIPQEEKPDETIERVCKFLAGQN
jgi:pimeloyl-ACP methyl ester carboxylesterase